MAAENMIPPGRYLARGIRGELGETLGGKEQVGVLVEITEDGDFRGQTGTWYGYFTEKTTKRTLESLRYLGWSTDDLSDLTGIDQNEVEVVVEHEADQNGVMKCKFSWINKPGGQLGINKPLDAGRKAAFAAKMKGLVISMKQGGGSPSAPAGAGFAAAGRPPAQQRAPAPPPQTQQAAMQIADEDIPF